MKLKIILYTTLVCDSFLILEYLIIIQKGEEPPVVDNSTPYAWLF